MLLGFKRQFAPYVLDGTKTHTIRAIRKHPPRVGEICHCYTGLRTMACKLLGRWPCVKVEEIRLEFWPAYMRIHVGGESLTPDEAQALAWRDGFREKDALAAMHGFWWKVHKMNEPGQVFDGHLIHWKVERMKKRHAKRATGEIEGRIRNLLRQIPDVRQALIEQRKKEDEMFDWIQREAFKIREPLYDTLAGCAALDPNGNLAFLKRLEIPGV